MFAAEAGSPFRRRIKFGDFPEGLVWLNTAQPLELKDLRGRFVLLDFWTYCCINCMHILPGLKKLEKAFPEELVVIGVHCGKFEAEKDADNIAAAIKRYEIEHPVINDPGKILWDRFEIQAWPSFLLIDPEGYLVWGASGEVTYEQLNKVLRAGLTFYKRHGLVKPAPAPTPTLARKGGTVLRFPGKVLADEQRRRLFIADSNHNRIVVTDFEGQIDQVIGSGQQGREDGELAAAQFNHPQGLALAGEILYVADTQNHLLRKVDLATGQVETIAGTGAQLRQAGGYGAPTRPKMQALASPWDLCIYQRDLYIAMAGSHQIWRMSLDESAISLHAGNGREDIVDGLLTPKSASDRGSASFAQPSGLATDGQWLYVADSEGSSIRAVPLIRSGRVRTLVGTAHLQDRRLFTFGDVDGGSQDARLQHPLGVAFLEGRLYVADTYNNKIKVLDPASGSIRTLLGDGQPGDKDSPPRFDEPAGISAAAGQLFVADTNNHLIRVVDLKKDNQVTTLEITR